MSPPTEIPIPLPQVRALWTLVDNLPLTRLMREQTISADEVRHLMDFWRANTQHIRAQESSQ
jgi:hypothetical protein